MRDGQQYNIKHSQATKQFGISRDGWDWSADHLGCLASLSLQWNCVINTPLGVNLGGSLCDCLLISKQNL